MAENTKSRLTRMLLSKSRRAQYARVFAVLGVCIAVAIAVILHQSGFALTHEEQVLTCPVTGTVAHMHDQSCYDKDGNLVCPLPERELHVHTDECYTVVKKLTCGKEESDEHKHTDECYTVVKELTCGKEESDEHKHTDACYAPKRELTCKKEEITEEHVHGPGCFTTVTVSNDEAEGDLEVAATIEENAENKAEDVGTESDKDEAEGAKAGEPKTDEADKSTVENTDAKAESDKATDAAETTKTANPAMPAQSFVGKIEDKDGKVILQVEVNAPEGAFPPNTTMRVQQLDAESLRTKVEDALKKDDVRFAGAKQMKAVDITFFDEQGNEIEPAVEVEVKITSDTVRDIADPVLVHVDKDESKDAEVLKKVDVVNQNEADKTEGTEDTLKFESNAFSPYVIVEPRVITAKVITASGDTYSVTVSYGKDAGIPDDATLSATEITEGEQGYDELAAETAKAVDTNAESIEHLRMFEISILDVDGNVLEPAAPVEVKIELVGESIDEEQELKVVHLADDGVEVIDPAAEVEDGTTDTLTFVTDSFSIYSVVSWQVASDFDVQSLAIVHVSNKTIKKDSIPENSTRYLGRAFKAETTSDGLKASNAVVELHESGRNIVTSDQYGQNDAVDNTTNTIDSWTFEAVPNTNNQYYIKSGDSYVDSYVCVSSNKLQLTDDVNARTAFTIEKDPNSDNVRIKSGDKYIRSSVSRDVKADNTDNPQFTLGKFDGKYCWFTLCEIEQVKPTEHLVYTGTKVSAQDLEDGASYFIYKNIYDEVSQSYQDYVIDGAGNLVKAYDKGDSLSLHSEVSPEWKLYVCVNDQSQPTDYYVFKNESTGLILHPLANGTLVKEYAEDSLQKDGVTLSGRSNGQYTSTIEFWDESVPASYGYQIVSDDTDGTRLLTGKGNDSQAFSFAVCEENSSSDEAQLHPVATIDSVAKGITIHMFDYPNRNTISNVTGSDSYALGVLPEQHVQPTLNDDRFPVFTNGNDGSVLFKTTGNSNYKGDANNLFLESVYDSTGYYEYSCFNNFAEYNTNTKKFTVYKEVGTPTLPGVNGGEDKFSYKRGNFFPFNSLDTNKKTLNLYNGDGQLLDYEDPLNGATLYGLQGNVDYWFGMTMDFDFIMPKDGKIDGNPLIYEFNGDDDLWIYVDGVLLLDIGGVHNAFSGKINFATGRITGGNGGAGYARTIKDCFKYAGVFPDGTPWDDSKVDNYFKGDTFVDFGAHSFNMFYMEHGAGASNLETRFNMPVIQKGTVEVTKRLDNTSQTLYANVSFAYQMFKKEGSNSIPVTNATYKGKTGDAAEVEFYDGVEIDGESYDNVFYLKPGETAVFSDIAKDQDYYVQEIGIKNDYYDEIYINGVKIDGEMVDEQNGVYRSEEKTPRNRAGVTFTNHCDNRNSNELLITKRLAEGTPSVDDTFEFRVMLENANGELVPYSEGTYYIRDDNGGFYRYKNGKYESNGQSPVAFTAGPNGTIANIPANYTIVIKDLLAGTDFYVDEIRTKVDGVGSDVLIGKSDWTLMGTKVENNDEPEITNATIYNYANNTSEENKSSTGSIAWSKDARVTFTNKLATTNVRLKKIDENGEQLSGATFTLTRLNSNGGWSSVVTDIKPGGTDADGHSISNPVELGVLRCGRYRLEEVSAPNGYNIQKSKFVYFEVYKDTSENNKVKARITDGNGDAITDNDIASVTFDQDDNAYTVSIKNTPGEELPATGGSGTTIFYVVGATVIAAGLLYGLSWKRYARRNG